MSDLGGFNDIETSAFGSGCVDRQGICLLSIAISLKRIADVVTSGEMASQFGGLTNLAWEMGRSFAAGQRTDR